MARIKDYKYKGTVDSEILLSHVEKNGMKEGLKALKGSAAVAIVSADEPNVIYLWRHSNPLWLAYNDIKKTLFFASTEDILREGLSDILGFFSSFHIRQTLEDILYKVTCDPLNIEAIEEIEPIGYGYYHSRSGRFSMDAYNLSGCGNEYEGMESENTPLNSDTPPNIPVNDGTMTSVYKEIMNCVWDSEKKIYTTEKTSGGLISNRFYFDGPSCDFEHWRRLEGGGHVSIDKKLVKFFDPTKKAHFVMLVTDAI